jgi:hypothetical protein
MLCLFVLPHAPNIIGGSQYILYLFCIISSFITCMNDLYSRNEMPSNCITRRNWYSRDDFECIDDRPGAGNFYNAKSLMGHLGSGTEIR